jgi:hypothetical protein
MLHGRKIAVIGLGYVGLPVAAAFARAGSPVIGFDIDAGRVRKLQAGQDRTGEVDASGLRLPALNFTSDRAGLGPADFFIVTVPTPIDNANRPDLSAMFEASRLVGAVLKAGDIVVYESTVYPGAVEEDCVPILERGSGLKAGADFDVGYSPERINPGDKKHRFETIAKVVSAQNAKTLDIVANVYGSGRHSPRALDQGRGSRQGDREHPARSEHRLHERTVPDFPGTRDRHRRRAGGSRHQSSSPAAASTTRWDGRLHANAFAACCGRKEETVWLPSSA